MLFYLFEYLLWSERHTMNIIAGSYFNVFRRSLHYVNGCIDCIVSVNHWKWGVLFEIAFVVLVENCFMENVDCIVSGPSSRRWSVTNQPWVSDTSDIYTVPSVVILAPQLSWFFSDSVDSGWIHYGFLRSLFGTIASEGCDGTGPEEFLNFIVSGSFQTVEQGSHVQLLGSSGVNLSTGREKGCQTVNVCDLVLSQEVIQMQPIESI